MAIGNQHQIQQAKLDIQKYLVTMRIAVGKRERTILQDKRERERGNILAPDPNISPFYLQMGAYAYNVEQFCILLLTL